MRSFISRRLKTIKRRPENPRVDRRSGTIEPFFFVLLYSLPSSTSPFQGFPAPEPEGPLLCLLALHYAPTAVAMSSPSVQVHPQTNGSKGNSGTASTSFDIVRCSRCQRSISLENDSSPDAVRFGMNSYYCSRCASMVGFPR